MRGDATLRSTQGREWGRAVDESGRSLAQVSCVARPIEERTKPSQGLARNVLQGQGVGVGCRKARSRLPSSLSSLWWDGIAGVAGVCNFTFCSYGHSPTRFLPALPGRAHLLACSAAFTRMATFSPRDRHVNSPPARQPVFAICSALPPAHPPAHRLCPSLCVCFFV